MNPPTGSLRAWLLENGYADAAQMIDSIMAEWKARGKKTRRNWFEVLAGDSKGRGRVIEQRQFPVIAKIRERQGMTPITTALRNSRRERAPQQKTQNRWVNKHHDE